VGLRDWSNRVKGAKARAIVKPDDEGQWVGCMGVEPSDLARHLNRIAELTPICGGGVPASSVLRALLDRAVEPHTLKPDGRYTEPPSYGVYELGDHTAGRARFHFGNHPIRQRELVKHFGSTRLIATFLDRSDAEELSRHFNDMGFEVGPWPC
jgi:hypothetical protein